MKIKNFITFVFTLFILQCGFTQSNVDPASAIYQKMKMQGLIEQPPDIQYHGPYHLIKPDVSPKGLLIPLDASFAVALNANDDGSTSEMTLPFNFTFYGDLLNSFFINNNGNISFDQPYGTYTPSGFPIAGFPMLAPFWADVDTRGSNSGLVYYRIEPNRLVVIWDHVGYFASHDNLLNTFELIVTDGTDPLIGIGNNVAFCFDDMQWTTGDASGGSGGFGGSPATVGINKGDGTNFALIGRFDHEGIDYDGPGGNNDGVSYLDNKCYYFNTGVEFNNIPPIIQGIPGGDVDLTVGDNYNLLITILSPEVGQITDAVVNVPLALTDFNYTVTSGNVCTVEIELLATNDNLGSHQVEIIATDDGIPVETSTAYINFNITAADPVIQVSPASLSESLYPDETSTQFFTIANVGAGPLEFNLEDLETSKHLKIKSVRKSTKGDFPDDYLNYLNRMLEQAPKSVTEVTWLSESPLLGTIPAGEEIQIEVGFDATAMDPDIYNAQILVNSNDPVTPQIVVPVTLEVLSMNCSYLTTDDNENNALEGIPDGDMDNYLCNDSPIVPIEFNIFIDEPVVESAQLSLYAWDVDETGSYPGYPEVDEVYLNGHLVGTLTGANDEWSTSVFNVDPEFINPGPDGQNLIQVFVSTLGPYWCVEIDWGQLVINNCMGGNAWIRYVDLDKSFYLQGENVGITVEVDTDIPTQDVIVETNLLDENMINIAGTSNSFTISMEEDEPLNVSLPLPPGATLGATYHAQVIVYDANTYLQQDLALVPFLIWDGNGMLNCLNPGWQIISSCMFPSDPQLEMLMGDLNLANAMVIMLNLEGFYWPSQNINLLGDWDCYSGYKIKMAEPGCIIFDGDEVLDKTANVLSGINYLPMLSTMNVPAADIFDQFGTDMLYAFDIQNSLVYWPEGGIYTLNALVPGDGYLISMLNDGSTLFPPTIDENVTQNKPAVVEGSPWQVENTGIPHIISISREALAELKAGDIIAAFNTEGTCVGMTQYHGENENLALVIYGDDFTTDATDGMIENEPINIGVYNPATEVRQDANPVWDPSMPQSGYFEEYGASAILQLKAGATLVRNAALRNIAIYPNPTTGYVHINGIENPTQISVLNAAGQLIQIVNADHAFEIDLTKLGKGVYYIKIISDQGLRVEKIMVK